MSLYEKLLHDLDNDPKVAKEVALGRRVRLYRVREQLGSGNFSKVKLGIHVLTKGMCHVFFIAVCSYRSKLIFLQFLFV